MKNYPEIETLIPHRKPILCIDKVISVEDLVAKTQYKIDEKALFCTNGSFSELGLLENAAQSSFVFLNFFLKDAKENLWSDGKDSIGFISHINSMTVNFLPKVHDKLLTTTTTELVFDAENLKICNVVAETTVNSELAFTTEMKMILQIREL
ncbi:hypothetical protein [Moheibacter sp.]|uniref:hypothetical protein n=1 Tax=Moheibacter sp. TaxID=1965316 RepID=UPI003C771B4B